MGITFRSAPEFRSVEAFVQLCCDDDRAEFTHEDLAALNYRLRTTVATVRRALEAYGLSLAVREVPRPVRGFTTSSNDRWFGPGSDRTHGGSGFSNFE
jgi:hypothetical protein